MYILKCESLNIDKQDLNKESLNMDKQDLNIDKQELNKESLNIDKKDDDNEQLSNKDDSHKKSQSIIYNPKVILSAVLIIIVIFFGVNYFLKKNSATPPIIDDKSKIDDLERENKEDSYIKQKLTNNTLEKIKTYCEKIIPNTLNSIEQKLQISQNLNINTYVLLNSSLKGYHSCTFDYDKNTWLIKPYEKKSNSLFNKSEFINITFNNVIIFIHKDQNIIEFLNNFMQNYCKFLLFIKTKKENKTNMLLNEDISISNKLSNDIEKNIENMNKTIAKDKENLEQYTQEWIDKFK